MATTPKSKLESKVAAAVEVPVEWIEERSGLISVGKYFLFRNVPRDISWLQTLGSALITIFIVQAVTGVVLAMYYKPDPTQAFQSIRYITDTATLGWLVRGMHKWGASMFVIVLFLHMGRVFLFGQDITGMDERAVLAEEMRRPELVWWSVVAVGVATTLLLWIYDRLVRTSGETT